MAHVGSRSGRRTEVSPPRDSAARNQRSGYVLLAVSGVVLATAFGGLASLIAPGSDAPNVAVPGGVNSSSGAQLVPGDAAPGQTPVTVDGVALPAGSRTAVVTTNQDGQQVVTLLPPAGSSEAPIVLPPGTPLPPGTVVPPGTTLPPGTTTTPPRSDPPPNSTSSSSPSPSSSNTATSTPGTTSPTTSPTSQSSTSTSSSSASTSPSTSAGTSADTSSSSHGSDSSKPTTP